MNLPVARVDCLLQAYEMPVARKNICLLQAFLAGSACCKQRWLNLLHQAMSFANLHYELHIGHCALCHLRASLVPQTRAVKALTILQPSAVGPAELQWAVN
jgi:hypothetical protein